MVFFTTNRTVNPPALACPRSSAALLLCQPPPRRPGSWLPQRRRRRLCKRWLRALTHCAARTSCWLGHVCRRWGRCVLLHGSGTVGLGRRWRRGGRGRWDCGRGSCWYCDRRLRWRCRESWRWPCTDSPGNKAACTRVEAECCSVGIETCTGGLGRLIRGAILPRVGHIGNDVMPGTDAAQPLRTMILMRCLSCVA